MDVLVNIFTKTFNTDFILQGPTDQPTSIPYLHLYILAAYVSYIALLLVKQDLYWRTKNTIFTVLLCLTAFWIQIKLNIWLNFGIILLGILIHWSCVEEKFLPADDRKAVLITGCDRGIGHELAKKLDHLGYTVFAGCLDSHGQGSASLVQSCSSNLKVLQLDVTDSEQVQKAAKQVKTDLKHKELWGIVNNAGICFIGNIETMTTEDINLIMSVNIMGPINICRAFFPLLRKSKGRLVNVASNTGLAPVPLMGVYCASKSALATFSEVMRYEMQAWGIKVSTIIPSGYRTGILAYDKKAAAERWWKSASADVKHDYGKDCFTPKFKMKNHKEVTSPDLSPIINCLIHALCSKSPRTYYYSGLLARSLPFLYLHLPTALCDLVMKLIGDWFEFKPSALNKQLKSS